MFRLVVVCEDSIYFLGQRNFQDSKNSSAHCLSRAEKRGRGIQWLDNREGCLRDGIFTEDGTFAVLIKSETDVRELT